MPFCRFCTCQIKLITFCTEDYAIQFLFPHDASFLWSGRMHYHPSLEPVISRSVTSCPPLLSRARLTSPSVASSLSKLLFGLLPPQYIGGTLFSVLAISPGVLAKSIVDHNGDRSSLPWTFHFDSAYSPRLPLFILVASRPETPIRNSFNSYDLREMIHKVIPPKYGDFCH